MVIPVRDRSAQLARCLAALDAGGARVLVVDDGSADPAATERVAAFHGAEVVRHPSSRGASAARNTGSARSDTALIAFVDSDCVPEPGWLARLAAHFADPQLAAVAPRIVAAPGTCATLIGRYEADRSPLDMGPHPGPVAPITPIPYVPSATLLVRRAALDDGFDERMAIGEDVDLVWRMRAAGWEVRYDPSIAVAHDHRDALLPWLRRRFVYGSSAPALAVRHRGSIPVAVVTPWSVAPWALLAVRRPGAALVAAAASAVALHVTVGHAAGGPPAGLPPTTSARLAAHGIASAGWSLTVAITRSWLPLTALAAARSRRVRRAVLVASILPRAVDLARKPRRLPLPAALLIAAADDAAYAAGLWTSSLRNRDVGALLPSLRAGRAGRGGAAGAS